MDTAANKYDCAFSLALDLISKKWVAKILWHLQETRRFTELEKLIPGIPRKVLIQHLKELEKYQLIERRSYPEMPPKVEYSITEVGMGLAPIFYAIAEWGYKNIESLQPGLKEDNLMRQGY